MTCPCMSSPWPRSLSGMHPQTLRGYERVGLVTPRRTAGGGRRYSMRDILALREIQRLSQDEGINLYGIKRILDLERELEQARLMAAELHAEMSHAAQRAGVHPRGGRPARRAAPVTDRRPGGRARPCPALHQGDLLAGGGRQATPPRRRAGGRPAAGDPPQRPGQATAATKVNKHQGGSDDPWMTSSPARARRRCRRRSGRPPRTATPRSSRCTCLLALLKQADGTAQPLLRGGRRGPGPGAHRRRRRCSGSSRRRTAPPPARPETSRQLLSVINTAASLAREMGDEYVSTEHLLVGLATGGGPMATALQRAGATPDALTERLHQGARQRAGHQPGPGVHLPGA